MLKRKISLIGALSLLIIAIPLVASSAPEVFKWKLQSAVPSGDPHMVLLNRFAANIEKMSGGRLKIEVLPSGAVVGAFEILDAVNKGVIDAGMWWTHYATGKHPAAGLFNAPTGGAGTGLDQMGLLAWHLQGEGRELYLEFYQKKLGMDVMAFLYAPDGPEAWGWFKKPAKSVEEFKKLRFRAPPGLPGEVYTEMGAKPVSMAGPEIMPAAERGVIDAGEWINPSTDLKMGFYDVFKYYCIQGLHQAIDIADIQINGERWRELPPEIKMMVEVASKASILEALTYFIAKNSEALKTLVEVHKVELFDAPADYPSEFIPAARRVLAKYEKKYPFFKKVMDSQRAFAAVAVPYRVQTLKQSLLLGEAAEKLKE